MINLRATLLAPETVAAIKAHAVAKYPNECCGAITPEGFVPLANVHVDAKHFFDCNDAVHLLREAGRLIALVHSHPNGPDSPSARDMTQQMVMDIPWGITITDGVTATDPFWWSDDLEPPPIEGRQFRHGPSGTDGRGDCYALIRDYYRLERNILLPEVPRADNWWRKPGGDLYAEGYSAAGFKMADSKFPEVGDVGLLQVGRSLVPQHACVYLGGGRILHHLTNQLSMVDSFVGWVSHLRMWLRHV